MGGRWCSARAAGALRETRSRRGVLRASCAADAGVDELRSPDRLTSKRRRPERLASATSHGAPRTSRSATDGCGSRGSIDLLRIADASPDSDARRRALAYQAVLDVERARQAASRPAAAATRKDRGMVEPTDPAGVGDEPGRREAHVELPVARGEIPDRGGNEAPRREVTGWQRDPCAGVCRIGHQPAGGPGVEYRVTGFAPPHTVDDGLAVVLAVGFPIRGLDVAGHRLVARRTGRRRPAPPARQHRRRNRRKNDGRLLPRGRSAPAR